MLASATVTLPQETHRSLKHAAVWCNGILPRTGTAFSTARPGARGGLQTGVAVLCPAPWTLAVQLCLAPG
eukprot:5021040-Lingulodinium_polyedra.AAC.1